MAAGSRSPSPPPPPPPRLLPLLFLVLDYLLLVLFSVPCRGEYACPNLKQENCGEVNISYPFWLSYDFPENNNSYCGYQGFMVTCELPHSIPILVLHNDSYRILNISYTPPVIYLADNDINPVTVSCPRVRHNVTWFPDVPLSYTNNDVNLTFLFECNNAESEGNSISCLQTGNNYVLAGNHPPYGPQNCHEIFVSPVLQSYLNDTGDLGSNYPRLLEHGFELNWSNDTDGFCANCEGSGGLCGQNNTNNDPVLACFRSDGTIEEYQKHYSSTDDAPHEGPRGKHHTALIIGTVTGEEEPFDNSREGALVAVGLLGAGILFYRYKKKRDYSASMKSFIRSASPGPSSRDPEKYSAHFQTYIFSYDELQEATNGFDNELGDGGFGRVYKGKLPDGRVVAVKRLYENYRQLEQFMNEIEILSRVRHPNLVDLYGWTSRNSKELLLVYEFMPNGTVADHLHGSRARERILTLPMRLNIAVETAEALAYLHAIDPPIIHRDVKTSNILLDSSFHVKVADFGLSRLFPFNATHVSTAPQGTPGYVDPEYHQCYQLTNRSDVYSFGVVLVELLSSKPAVDITRHRKEINLANWALNRIQNGELDQLADESLGYQSDQAARKTVTMVSEVAFRCLQVDGDMRPPMKEVLEALLAAQSEVNKVSKGGKEPGDNEDDAGLLKNVVPMSPDTVMNQWVSNSTTPNTSKD